MGLSAGIEGIFRFKFTGNLSDQCLALVKNTILAGVGKSCDFTPIDDIRLEIARFPHGDARFTRS